MPTLSQIEYALAVAREGSFSTAARVCFVSQPALSAQVAKLEEELGCRLFDRSARPVVLTEAGASLLPRLRAVVDATRGLTEGARELEGALRGNFRLGIIPTVAQSLLPRFLSGFCAAHPEVQLSVKELTTEAIIAGLRDDRLDAGVLATPLSEPDIHETQLFDEAFHAYASPELSLPRDAQGQLQLSDLPLDQLIVMNEGHCLRTQVLDLCALSEGGTPGFRIEVGSLGTLLGVLERGPWFTILPELSLAQAQPVVGEVHPFSGETPYRQVGLVYRRRDLGARIREALVEAIRQNVPDSMRAGYPEGKLLRPVMQDPAGV